MLLMVLVLYVPTDASVGGASSGDTHNGKEAKKAAKKPEQAGPLGACKSLHNKYTKVGEATSGAAKAPCSTEGEGAAAPRVKEAEIYAICRESFARVRACCARAT